MTTACLVGEEEYQADGVAETAVRAVAVPRCLFDTMVAASCEFRRFVFAAFGRRVTSLLRVIEDVAFARQTFWGGHMTRNVGSIDRIVVGLGLISIAFWGPQTPWGWIGVVPLLTAVVGWCPPYALLGINTCGRKGA